MDLLRRGEPNPLAIPLYQPGLPALRVENNVVRVPLGVALEAVGFGPFFITGNHFSSGGTVPVDLGSLLEAEATLQQTNQARASVLGAMTVLILNLGLAVEFDNPGGAYSSTYLYAKQSSGKITGSSLASSSSGAVHFTNNICQLETRASGATGFASVEILSLDQLTFSNNHCWLDGPGTAPMDALLFSLSLNACGNRFQELVGSVLVSGLTFGLCNITAQNISTFCLFPEGGQVVSSGNLVLDPLLCPDFAFGR